MPRHNYKPGDQIRWTANFLRWICDYSKDSADQRFTVVECACMMCHSGYIAVDSAKIDGEYRHMAVGNVERAP